MKVKNFIIAVICALGGYAGGAKKYQKIVSEETKRKQKMTDYFELMNVWMELLEDHKEVAKYFEKNNMKRIAIYGVGKIGEHLFKQLQNSNIEILYFIDKRAVAFGHGVEVLSLEDKLEKVDAVVVTPVYDYNAISSDLKKKCDYKIVSIEDVIYETYEEL